MTRRGDVEETRRGCVGGDWGYPFDQRLFVVVYANSVTSIANTMCGTRHV